VTGHFLVRKASTRIPEQAGREGNGTFSGFSGSFSRSKRARYSAKRCCHAAERSRVQEVRTSSAREAQDKNQTGCSVDSPAAEIPHSSRQHAPICEDARAKTKDSSQGADAVMLIGDSFENWPVLARGSAPRGSGPLRSKQLYK